MKETVSRKDDKKIYQSEPTDKVLKPDYSEFADEEIKRRQMEEGYNPSEDPEDLDTYMDQYRNDCGDI